VLKDKVENRKPKYLVKKIELGKVSLAERKRRTHFDRSRLNLEASLNAATHQKKSKSNTTKNRKQKDKNL
tara:strand:- start:236 stop:445 length:210 start_codon:yes stop_codon:yes gene_type:complete